MVDDDLTEREQTLRAALAAKMYRLEHAGESVVRKDVLAGMVAQSDREQFEAEHHLDAMCTDGSAPVDEAIGGGAVELAHRDDEQVMYDWVSAYVARLDAADRVDVPSYDADDHDDQ